MEKRNTRDIKNLKTNNNSNQDSFQKCADDWSLISREIQIELESRYKWALENPEDGLSWEEVKKSLMEK
jgi:hypothetical protein